MIYSITFSPYNYQLRQVLAFLQRKVSKFRGGSKTHLSHTTSQWKICTAALTVVLSASLVIAKELCEVHRQVLSLL